MYIDERTNTQFQNQNQIKILLSNLFLSVWKSDMSILNINVRTISQTKARKTKKNIVIQFDDKFFLV